MTKQEFTRFAKEKTILLDGATGSYLKTRGMPVAGVCTEKWAYEHPDIVADMQRAYRDAGSDIIYAPTFSANRLSLEKLGLGDMVETLNRTLVERTVKTVGENVLVAGDLSTTGQALEPVGTMSYDRLLEVYKEQMKLQAEAGADLFVAETLLSLEEAMVICDAAQAVADLPLFVSFTCEGDGNLYFGGSIYEAAETLESMGVSAVGVNCSVGPDQLEAVIQNLSETVSIPVIAKPNAGMPVMTETGQAVYSMKEDEFARHVHRLRDCGASIVGGCCGTTPEYIRRLKKELS